MSSKLQTHLRTTLLTGLFAFIPLAITVYIVYWVNEKTKPITLPLFGRAIPFVGLIIIVVAVYVIGLAGSSLIGKWFLGHLDAVLSRLPILRTLYISWKQVAITPGGTEGVFSHIVLVPESEDLYTLGFTSLRPLPNDPDFICVLIFNAPTPTTGRMFFVRRDRCVELAITAEEAFKVILSAGNYIAPEIGEATRSLTANGARVRLPSPPPSLPGAIAPPETVPAPVSR